MKIVTGKYNLAELWAREHGESTGEPFALNSNGSVNDFIQTANDFRMALAQEYPDTTADSVYFFIDGKVYTVPVFDIEKIELVTTPYGKGFTLHIALGELGNENGMHTGDINLTTGGSRYLVTVRDLDTGILTLMTADE